MQNRNNANQRLRRGLRDLQQQKYAAVHAEAIAMIGNDVNDPVPYFLLGVLADDHRNFERAIELFNRAASLSPKTARFHVYLARTLNRLNRQNDAHAAALCAASCEIQEADVADMIGVIFSRTGYHEDAVPMFERAISIDPRPANFHYNLAASLQFSGEFDRAEKSYKKALARDPMLYRAWSSLVSLSRQTPDSHHVDQLKRLFGQLGSEPDAALHLGHAIAKSLEDLDAYQESLVWLGKAKRLKRKALAYNLSDDLKIFDAAKSTRPTHEGSRTSQEPAPIFIVGLPRTGTTLVDRILSSHPDVRSAGELNTFAGLIKSATASLSNFVLDAETLRASENIDLREIGQSYWQSTEGLRRSAVRMTDKMPLNFFYVGLIHRALPNARIVALQRGAMDSCLSNYRQLFSTGFSYYNYSLDLQDTARYYAAFHDLMAHWRRSLPENRFMEVRYEDIIADQENQTRKLLEFCGLDWNEACLRFHENTAPVSTASSVQVRQPLYSGSVGRWKRYGDALDELKAALGPLAEDAAQED